MIRKRYTKEIKEASNQSHEELVYLTAKRIYIVSGPANQVQTPNQTPSYGLVTNIPIQK